LAQLADHERSLLEATGDDGSFISLIHLLSLLKKLRLIDEMTSGYNVATTVRNKARSCD
jgi:hypothetical protein